MALDSLMQQLQDESQVSIFNTVYDMRHQRNFLVQSLVSKINNTQAQFGPISQIAVLKSKFSIFERIFSKEKTIKIIFFAETIHLLVPCIA